LYNYIFFAPAEIITTSGVTAFRKAEVLDVRLPR
jgi:hypothetical protein